MGDWLTGERYKGQIDTLTKYVCSLQHVDNYLENTLTLSLKTKEEEDSVKQILVEKKKRKMQ